MMRINKYLSACGICSRREADRLIEAGHVSLNGRTAVPGDQAEEGDLVEVDGQRAVLPAQKTYLKFYKPKGVVCTFEKREPANLGSWLQDNANLTQRVTYAGRLDRNSEGLLILTDDGDLIREMMTGRNGHEKEYEVVTDRPVTEDMLKKMRAGVFLPDLGVKTHPCRAEKTGPNRFSIVLTQGLNRQIRRMCHACGCEVKALKRVRVVNIVLGDMRPGEIRAITGEELSGLQGALGGRIRGGSL